MLLFLSLTHSAAALLPTHTDTLPFAHCLFVLRAVFYCLWYCWRVVVVVVALVVFFVAAPLPCCCSVRSF